MKLRPMGYKVMLRMLEQKTKGGLIILDTAEDNKTPTAIVERTSVLVTNIQEGDKVFFNKRDALQIEIEGETYFLIEETDILAKVE